MFDCNLKFWWWWWWLARRRYPISEICPPPYGGYCVCHRNWFLFLCFFLCPGASSSMCLTPILASHFRFYLFPGLGLGLQCLWRDSVTLISALLLTYPEQVLFWGASRVGLWVRQSKWPDLVHVKTKMFRDGPFIASLYFGSSEVKVKDAKRQNRSCRKPFDLFQLTTKMFKFRSPLCITLQIYVRLLSS